MATVPLDPTHYYYQLNPLFKDHCPLEIPMWIIIVDGISKVL